jgi:hypothetical protein
MALESTVATVLSTLVNFEDSTIIDAASLASTTSDIVAQQFPTLSEKEKQDLIQDAVKAVADYIHQGEETVIEEVETEQVAVSDVKLSIPENAVDVHKVAQAAQAAQQTAKIAQQIMGMSSSDKMIEAVDRVMKAVGKAMDAVEDIIDTTSNPTDAEVPTDAKVPTAVEVPSTSLDIAETAIEALEEKIQQSRIASWAKKILSCICIKLKTPPVKV